MKYLISLMILLFLFALAPTSFADVVNMPTPAARVVWIKGALKATMPNGEERFLKAQSIVYEQDTLITDAASQAEIVFSDNTLMTFREGTTFIVKEYAFHPKGGEKSVGKYVMSLIEGGFRTVTGLIAKSNPTDYQVVTPVATIGVRGTDYAVYLSNGQLFVGYYKGSPCVTNNKKDKTVCLDQATPYAYVPNAESAPVPLTQRPDGFKSSLPITPMQGSSFIGAPGVMFTPINPGGATNFCISQ
jgi:hypothetical protein